MTAEQRYRAIAFIAQAAHARGDFSESGRRFLEASDQLSGDERAEAARALGYEMLDDKPRAYELARRLAERFPGSLRPWAIICRTAPFDRTAESLRAELPPQAVDDAATHVALAMRGLRDGDWTLVEEQSSRAIERESDWVAPYILRSLAMLGRVVSPAYTCDRPLIPTDNADLIQALAGLDHAVRLACTQRDTPGLVEALLQRAKLHSARGENHKAESDLFDAQRQSPLNPTVSVELGKFLITCDRFDEAVRWLRKALEQECGGDVYFPLTLAMREVGDVEVAEWTEFARLAAEEIKSPYRYDSLRLAISGYAKMNRWEDAETLIAQVANRGQESAAQAGRAQLASLRGRNTDAAEHVRQAAMVLGADVTDAALLRHVATAASVVGDLTTALDLWRRVATLDRQLLDARQYVATAAQLGRFDLVKTFCKDLRLKGVRDEKLFEYELWVLERYEPQAALALIQEELLHKPDDPALLLARSIFGLRLRRTDLLCGDPLLLPQYDDSQAERCRQVIEVLWAAGQHEAALRYAYEALRHHANDADTHRAYIGLFLRLRPEDRHDLLESPSRVEPGAAIQYRDLATEKEAWLVVEDNPRPDAFPDEIGPEDARLVRLRDVAVGDTVVLSGDDIDGRKIRLDQVLNKYVYRFRYCLQEFQVRFPSESGLEMLQMGPAKGEGELPDITPLVRRLHEHKRHTTEVLDFYRGTPIPIHMLSESLSRHPVDVVRYLAESPEHSLFCRVAGEKLLDATRTAVVASGIVLDLSAIATVDLLEVHDLLPHWPVPILISQSTVDQLLIWKETAESDIGKAWAESSESGLGLNFRRAKEEELDRNRHRVRRTVDSVLANAKRVDCPLLAAMDPGAREQLLDLLGPHGAESVVLGSEPGRVLWTDDGALAAVAKELTGSGSVWTQPFLRAAVETGLVDEFWCQQKTAKLLLFGYVPTEFGVPELKTVVEMTHHSGDRQALHSVLKVFSGPMPYSVRLRLAAAFIFDVLTVGFVVLHSISAAYMVVDQLAARPEGADVVADLWRALRFFAGVNFAAERKARQFIEEWQEMRGRA
jgi:tetratricopeptide (TPR) repeat protein